MATRSLNERARINGTTVRLRYLETSVGNSAVDRLMGGGLPLSGIYLVDEHNSRTYASVLARYFLAEVLMVACFNVNSLLDHIVFILVEIPSFSGVIHKHSLLIASPSRDPSEVLSKLPQKVEEKVDERSSESSSIGDVEPMKIAWRYASVPKVDSSIKGQRLNKQYDLTKTMDRALIDCCDISKYPSDETSASYSQLWNQLIQILSCQKYRPLNALNGDSNSSSSERNLLRIVIEGERIILEQIHVTTLDFGSPMWSDSEMELKFMARLRTLINDYYVVVMLTVNSNSIDPQRRDRIYSYCDAAFVMETIDDPKLTASNFGDSFDGYFRIVKLPSISSIGCNCPESSDLTFELHRRRFDIKILHLPPALDDDSSVDGIDKKSSSRLPCQSMLDF
ncbi:unnamed protein product [Anisakis simplex]|uniref:Elongator complex protein 4 n=1 Tax=Anisakis simplex TaxID=6269 RepID=A0A0M3J0X3_ANISI|nr:unnamed protein product [Anisakis simplex]